MDKFSLLFCLLKEEEIGSDLKKIRKEHPDAEIEVEVSFATLALHIKGERLAGWEAVLRKKFRTHLVPCKTLQEAVHQNMIAEKKSLALAESCTGGALSALLVSLPGASRYFLGSLVVYSNAWKQKFLGVSPGLEAVSSEAVEQMLQGLFERTETDYAIAISGILGPEGGMVEKPVGTVFLGIAQRDGFLDLRKIQAPPHREEGIEFVVQTALALLWRRIAYQITEFS
jgi:nicotinamide-nucleotide amidase